MTKLIPTKGYITRYLESKKPKRSAADAGTSLYHLRNQELDDGLAFVLNPFIQAYAPHGPTPKPKQLKEEGYELVRSETFTDDLREVYWELRGYYPEENPDLDSDED